jgi:hypothetical protein
LKLPWNSTRRFLPEPFMTVGVTKRSNPSNAGAAIQSQ